MNIRLKTERDMARAKTVNGVAYAPLAERVVDSVLEAVRLQDRERRTKIEQHLRGLSLGPDDTVDLTHSIHIKIDSESGRTA